MSVQASVIVDSGLAIMDVPLARAAGIIEAVATDRVVADPPDEFTGRRRSRQIIVSLCILVVGLAGSVWLRAILAKL